MARTWVAVWQELQPSILWDAKGQVSNNQPKHGSDAAQARAAVVGNLWREVQHTSPGALWAMLRAWPGLVTHVRGSTKQLPPPDCKAHLRIRLTQRLILYSSCWEEQRLRCEFPQELSSSG